ncbi:hypothetical protein GCM10023238_28510 [Streptomyces heliomycini]
MAVPMDTPTVKVTGPWPNGSNGPRGERRSNPDGSAAEALPVGHARLVGGQEALVRASARVGACSSLAERSGVRSAEPLDAQSRVQGVDAVLALGGVALEQR